MDALAAAVQTAVSAVMTSQVLAVRPDVSLEVLTELFLERGIGGAPVVDADGRPVGVISDIMRWLAQQGGYMRPEATSLTSPAATPES